MNFKELILLAGLFVSGVSYADGANPALNVDKLKEAFEVGFWRGCRDNYENPGKKQLEYLVFESSVIKANFSCPYHASCGTDLIETYTEGVVNCEINAGTGYAWRCLIDNSSVNHWKKSVCDPNSAAMQSYNKDTMLRWIDAIVNDAIESSGL